MHEINAIAREVVDAGYRLHDRLGPGLLETVYEVLLCRSLEKRGLMVERQKPVTFEFDGVRFDNGFRVDLLVEGRVVVELKSIEKLASVHHKQVLTYLRLLDQPVGLLINFGAPLFKDGCFRIINSRAPDAAEVIRDPKQR